MILTDISKDLFTKHTKLMHNIWWRVLRTREREKKNDKWKTKMQDKYTCIVGLMNNKEQTIYFYLCLLRKKSNTIKC